MEINPEDIVNVDYRAFDIAVQKIKPTVFMDGDSYCCISGPDPQAGVFGCGSTPIEAVQDWQKSLIEKLNAIPRNDAATKKVREELGLGDRPISDDMQAFMDQFYTRKKK